MNYPTIAPSTAPSTIGLPSRGSVLRRLSLGALSCSCILALAPALTSSQALADDETGSFWTEFIPSTDTRLIFVSASEGKDTNTGLTADSPVKSLEKGYTLLRDGSPDWMLLKRGDTWNEPLPVWNKSGRSESEIMIVGAYGDETSRPQIRPENVSAIRIFGSIAIEHIAFVGMHFEPKNPQESDRASGVLLLKSVNNLLFEDLYVANWNGNFNLQAFDGAVGTDVRLNGCVVVDSWSDSSHAQGIYAQALDGLVIENCVIDHNGYNDDQNAPATIYNHNLYINNGTKNVIVRNNIIANASSHGIQLRPGGMIEDNLFLSNPIAILIGGGTHPEEGGVTGSVQNNLVMYGRNITDDQQRSWGIDITNIRSVEVNNNILYSAMLTPNSNAINMRDYRDDSFGLMDLSVRNNSIINWPGGLSVGAPGAQSHYENILIESNSFYLNTALDNKTMINLFDSSDSSLTIRNNEYNHIGSDSRAFNDSGRYMDSAGWSAQAEDSGLFNLGSSMPTGLGLETYLAANGIDGDMDDFIELARTMSRQNFNPVILPQVIYDWHAEQLSD